MKNLSDYQKDLPPIHDYIPKGANLTRFRLQLWKWIFRKVHLTLCHPGFWIMVITWGVGGPQDPQLYFVFLGPFIPPSINVEPNIEKGGNYCPRRKKKSKKSWKPDDLQIFRSQGEKIKIFENILYRT